MRALLLATSLLLAAATTAHSAPAHAATAHAATSEVAAMDYWQYMATYATEEECEAEGAKIPESVDYYICWPNNDVWDFYWVFLT